MVRVLILVPKRLSLPRLVSLCFPFQGAECGILWAERQIPSYLHTLVGVTPIKPTKKLRFYGAKKLGLDLYRIQIARSSEL